MTSLCTLISTILLAATQNVIGQRVVCYYASWTFYNENAGHFEVGDIDPFLCTHLVYSFIGLGNDSRINVLDPQLDLEEDGGLGHMKKLTDLKNQNPDLKVMLSIGGWVEGSTNYSNMVSTAENRQTFIKSILPFLESQNFDGLDFDWEYPTERGGKPEDRENFDLLLSELKAAFEPRGYILSAAIGGNIGDELIQTCYNIANISRILDFMNVMTYCYHNSMEGFAHHHSPLYAHEQDAAHGFADFNSDHTMSLLVSLGAAPEKMNLGIGSFGRGVTLLDENSNEIYANSTGPIPGGPLTNTSRSWGYFEICATIGPEEWTVVRLGGQVTSPYAYEGNSWIAYDDPQSVNIKTQYAKDGGFGVFTWAIGSDDFNGSCHGETFPLVRTMRQVMTG